MPAIPDRKVVRAPTRKEIEAAGVTPDDIEPEWIDDMVKRLFKALQTELARVESTKANDNDTKCAAVRNTNARTLDTIERTLERLVRMESERVASRQTKSAGQNEQLRIQLECRINNLLAARGLPGLPRRIE